ncbi:MAG: phosphoglucomutase (alpha-D-glucose-1,6-bisphosphate-dependent) [Planctomycetaceae bacterium]|jgi:phosphoglucomutase|nr:phosphoglucomutase (alpha-D-glucose-1,6-bisphosphate-dependent) [Planctomycetaceae bacterium]
MVSELAGKPAPESLLIDVSELKNNYFQLTPDVTNAAQKVSFGTSGHRGTPLNGSFTESHILAITQAICEYRAEKCCTGPLFLGKDTHAASSDAQRTAVEVLAANNVTVILQENEAFTPTPVISHAILTYNRENSSQPADGIIITPSHNPPCDGGIKYNSPHGGPADTDATGWIQDRANELLRDKCKNVKRLSHRKAYQAATTHPRDFMTPYITDLRNIIDLTAISRSGIRIGVDPLGGAGCAYWEPIAEMYGLNITVVNSKLDPTFSFMSVDHDGKIRMDCSSPYSMTKLVALAQQFDVAVANDPDTDRHGIVTPSAGLMNPNHYLSVAIDYLFKNRNNWATNVGIGKTLVSSSMIDRVAAGLNRRLIEVPVGFKWFVNGLFDGTIGFGGEESAGASFLKLDGKVWSTDKDGIILNLLAMEILAKTSQDPGLHYRELENRYGKSYYTRVDQPATLEQKAAFKNLTPEKATVKELAGEPIISKLTNAPGNNAPIGGLKIVTENGWFAARPSGTENIYKIYAESFHSKEHLQQILNEAREIVTNALT